MLHFDVQEGEPPIAPPPPMEEKTLIMDTDQYQALLASSYQKGGTEEIHKEEVAVLSFMVGGAGEYKLSKKVVNIGKGSFNDIVVGGWLVGKVCASVSQRPTGYYLSYLGGWSKPKVNGKSVGQSTKLADLDIIEIGSTKMQFVQKSVYTK
ncbi:MAG TPA: hypothetical protein DEO88_14020 [Syntrophobacteraceae bacterium]|nr:hypothetical protein [Syntrophobacteraceae bacterium]